MVSGKESTCQCRKNKSCGFYPWVGKISWRRAWQPTPVLLLAEYHGQRSLAGYSLWGPKESDTTEHKKGSEGEQGLVRTLAFTPSVLGLISGKQSVLFSAFTSSSPNLEVWLFHSPMLPPAWTLCPAPNAT